MKQSAWDLFTTGIISLFLAALLMISGVMTTAVTFRLAEHGVFSDVFFFLDAFDVTDGERAGLTKILAIPVILSPMVATACLAVACFWEMFTEKGVFFPSAICIAITCFLLWVGPFLLYLVYGIFGILVPTADRVLQFLHAT